MVRLSKLADYALVLLCHMVPTAGEAPTASPVFAASALARVSGLPLPTVGKLLKLLARGGLLAGRRGVQGGYWLARPPEAISVLAVVELIDGPVALTTCTARGAQPLCQLQADCPTRPHWGRINSALQQALANVSLRDMKQPLVHQRPALQRASDKGA